MKLLILLMIFFSTALWARPEKVTVFFLSPQKVSFKDTNPILFSPLLAADDHCKKVEGGCFDPQRGFIADEDYNPKKIKPQMNMEGFSGDMIQCEKGNFFDLYCGKSRKLLNRKKIKVGIWIDISGSMKDEDFSTNGLFCQRRTFAEKIIQACKHNVAISQFTTSLATVGTPATLCRSSGTNNTKKMIRWIESANYKHLYIVTDTDENNMQFAAYLSKIGATSVGIGTKDLYATGLEGHLGAIITACQR